MISQAETLQEHENRGYRFANTLLAHANEDPESVRLFALRATGFDNGTRQVDLTVRRTRYLETARRNRAIAGPWAFMAGVELAIEQHEAGTLK